MAFNASDHIDIVTQLLNSNDANVAAAAKRIFTPAATSDHSIATKPIVDKQGCPSCTSVAPNVISHNEPQSTSTTISVRQIVTDVVNSSHDTLGMNNAVNETHSDGIEKTYSSKKQITPQERLQRSRERNKIHARKTRQRKKEHMLVLEKKACDLKNQQINLKLLINEKNTANILLAMFTTNESHKSKESTVDPRIEEILKRPTIDIPDASKIPELPTLVLPGNRNNRKKESSKLNCNTILNAHGYPNDGINYDLLAKDRSKCTPTELDKIRRERNRMHAKRTRDRKKRFMDEMEIIIRQLEDENELLSGHLQMLSEKHPPSRGDATPSLASPMPESQLPTVDVRPMSLIEKSTSCSKTKENSSVVTSDAVTVSDDGVNSEAHELSSLKRRRIGEQKSYIDDCVPTSITTTTNDAHSNNIK